MERAERSSGVRLCVCNMHSLSREGCACEHKHVCTTSLSRERWIHVCEHKRVHNIPQQRDGFTCVHSHVCAQRSSAERDRCV